MKINILIIILTGYQFIFNSLLASDGATLSGTVMNGSTGKTVPCEWIRLIAPGGSMQTAAETTYTANFIFSRIKPDPKQNYILRVSYKSVVYSEFIKMDSARVYTFIIQVFDTSSSEIQTDVSVPQLIFSKSQGQLYIEETYEINNRSSYTYLTTDYNIPTFYFKAPLRTDLISARTTYKNNMWLPADTIIYKNKIGIYFPIRPGINTVQIRYTAPYDSDKFCYIQDWHYDLQNIYAFVTPSDIRVEANDFITVTDEQLKSNNFSAYQKNLIQSGEKVTINLYGGSDLPEEDAVKILTSPNLVQKYNWWIILFLIMIFLIYIMWYRKNYSK
jgi:hypothetical protein